MEDPKRAFAKLKMLLFSKNAFKHNEKGDELTKSQLNKRLGQDATIQGTLIMLMETLETDEHLWPLASAAVKMVSGLLSVI